MSILREIIPFTDKHGLVTPKPADPKDLYGSGNGVMYTSELYVIAYMIGHLNEDDIDHFHDIIDNCMLPEGILNRAPIDIQAGQEGPDDYYGLMNACMQLGITDIPQRILMALIKNKGCLNNVTPGKWTLQSFLIRQPQLLTCILSAAYPGKSIKERVIRLLALPLYALSALILATNGSIADPKHVDVRRLGWHLLHTLTPVSYMAKLASKLWYVCLYNTYGKEGMKVVSAQYYSETHPFNKWFVD